MTLTAALPLIEGAGALLMFVLDAFILVFNGALEFIARIADFFGKGDSVRQFKIQKDTSADAANDIDFSEIYQMLVDTRIKQNDLMILLSGSGNSMNLIKCANKAKEFGIKQVSSAIDVHD